LSFPGDNELFVNLSEDSISDYLKTNRNSDKTKTNAYSIGVKGGKPGMNQLSTIRINSDEKGKLNKTENEFLAKTSFELSLNFENGEYELNFIIAHEAAHVVQQAKARQSPDLTHIRIILMKTASIVELTKFEIQEK
jgi:hypothetical protein